jgi:hypothetical protein
MGPLYAAGPGKSNATEGLIAVPLCLALGWFYRTREKKLKKSPKK